MSQTYTLNKQKECKTSQSNQKQEKAELNGDIKQT